MKIGNLISGGIITNYICTSKCAHCSYSSSPNWPKEYMDQEMADKIFKDLKAKRIDSVHLGGGEPFIYPEKLFKVLEKANENSIHIEYIETNSSFFTSRQKAKEILEEVKSLGVDTLFVSIDPFHNEYIPFYKVKALIEVLSELDMGIFPWRMEFFDDKSTHTMDEYIKAYGKNYLSNLKNRYRINLKGNCP